MLQEMITDFSIRPSFPAHVPKSIRALAADCWVNNPQKRPTFSEVQLALEELARDGRAAKAHNMAADGGNNKSYQSILHKARPHTRLTRMHACLRQCLRQRLRQLCFISSACFCCLAEASHALCSAVWYSVSEVCESMQRTRSHVLCPFPSVCSARLRRRCCRRGSLRPSARERRRAAAPKSMPLPTQPPLSSTSPPSLHTLPRPHTHTH